MSLAPPTQGEKLVPRSGEWLAEPGFGIYVHIPFCRHRCHYCDFNTSEGLDALHGMYVDAVVDDVRRWHDDARPVTSVFFGGGTPTLLDPAELGRIVEAIGDRFDVAADAEITVEANPETVDVRSLEGLLAAGFNRISIGIQSAAPAVLRALGRTHSPEVAFAAVAAARTAGFSDINTDLIFGSPWEADHDWEASLEAVLAARPDHVSAYALTVEEGTPLHTIVATGRVADIDPDVQAERYSLAERMLGRAGYRRYEISNWCLPQRASRHNVLYWSAGDYMGFGAGAHSHITGTRWWTKRLPRDYISSVPENATRAGDEALDADERGGEALMLGLRLASGIDRRAFDRRFGTTILEQRRDVIEDLIAADLLETNRDHLRLTQRGSLVANDVLCRLL